MPESQKMNISAESLVVEELKLRRSDLIASRANLYLRGTVLSAISAGQIMGIAPLPMPCVIKTSLYWILLVAFICGLISFWPRRKNQYTIALLRSYLLDHGERSILGYQKYLTEENEEDRKSLSHLNWFIVAGFLLSGLAFISLALTTLIGA
jgi:hypothetical protein